MGPSGSTRRPNLFENRNAIIDPYRILIALLHGGTEPASYCEHARRIVGWRVSRSAHAGFVLDALEQAIHDRKPVSGGGLVHHSDRGVQYVSIKYTERLAKAGLVPSVGSVGDSTTTRSPR